MNNSKVYVPQPPLTGNGGASRVRKRFDISPAEQFGELTYLCEWEDLDKINPDALLFELRSKLKDYCDDDYVIMVGNPTLMVLCAMVAGEVNGGRVNLLYWRREQHHYVVVNIDMEATPYSH